MKINKFANNKNNSKIIQSYLFNLNKSLCDNKLGIYRVAETNKYKSYIFIISRILTFIQLPLFLTISRLLYYGQNIIIYILFYLIFLVFNYHFLNFIYKLIRDKVYQNYLSEYNYVLFTSDLKLYYITIINDVVITNKVYDIFKEYVAVTETTKSSLDIYDENNKYLLSYELLDNKALYPGFNPMIISKNTKPGWNYHQVNDYLYNNPTKLDFVKKNWIKKYYRRLN